MTTMTLAFGATFWGPLLGTIAGGAVVLVGQFIQYRLRRIEKQADQTVHKRSELEQDYARLRGAFHAALDLVDHYYWLVDESDRANQWVYETSQQRLDRFAAIKTFRDLALSLSIREQNDWLRHKLELLAFVFDHDHEEESHPDLMKAACESHFRTNKEKYLKEMREVVDKVREAYHQ